MNDACSSLTQVLAIVDENGNVKQTYQRGLGLISYSESLGDEGNEITYYLSDGRGSVTALLKEGSITDRYHYDAYGNLIKKTGSSENEYLYNGESYSETTGLYYQRARYMNPTTGTFISMDAYSGTTDNPVSQHKYLYANANPVMYEDPSGYMSMMEMQVGMTMKSILMGGISNMFYVSLSNDAQENGMSIGEMLEAFAVGAIYTMLGLMVALLFEIMCPALLILGIILSPFIVLYNGHNAMRQAQALGEDRQAAFCYITTILGSLAAAVGGPRAAFDLMDYRMSNGIPRQGNAGQGCVGAENEGNVPTVSNVNKTSTVVNGTDDIANYQYNMIENPGPLAEMPNQPARNFYGGRYNIGVLHEDTIMYRAGNANNPYGHWFTSEPPSSVASVRIDTAVRPHWINPTTGAWENSSYIDYVYAIRIPKGTTVYTGPVGPQGGVHVGGYNIMQTYIDAPWNFEVIGRTPLH